MDRKKMRITTRMETNSEIIKGKLQTTVKLWGGGGVDDKENK